MNEGGPKGDKSCVGAGFLGRTIRDEDMGTLAFWLGVAGLSLIIFRMSQSGGNRSRGTTSASSGFDGGNYAVINGWGLSGSDASCSSNYGIDGGAGGECGGSGSGDF